MFNIKTETEGTQKDMAGLLYGQQPEDAAKEDTQRTRKPAKSEALVDSGCPSEWLEKSWPPGLALFCVM